MTNITHFQDLFISYGFNPDDTATLENLKKIFSTKKIELICENNKAYINGDLATSDIVMRTLIELLPISCTQTDIFFIIYKNHFELYLNKDEIDFSNCKDENQFTNIREFIVQMRFFIMYILSDKVKEYNNKTILDF